MNIAYLCADRGIPVLGHKGASVHVREMVGAFARTGHEVALFCTQRGEGNPPPPGECMELPIPDDPDLVRTIAAERGLDQDTGDKALRSELLRLAHDRTLTARILGALQLRGRRPDLLYERYSLMHRAGIEIAEALGIPHILEVNAPLVEEQAKFRGLIQRELAERIEREVFNRASHIVAVSEAMKAHAMNQGVPESHISVLPNGVDTSRFNTAIDKLLIRARHGLSGCPVIGFVGSLKPWHGIDLLLDAFQIVRRQHIDARLLIVGDGPVMENLRARVTRERLGRSVVLTGHVPHDEIPAYLAAMDITVAPYQPQQDFYFSPMKVIESMATGRPVVAPRIGQLTELVEDGVTGRLYAPGDTAACAAAIAELLHNPLARRAMGQHAANRAQTAFSWDSNATRVAALVPALHVHAGAAAPATA
ncbi:glycosyltransferase family 4 protein [Acidihalobacter prosperus]|uniref:Glycosyl transferase n=1 Tax=Acidihalobacter prosperus TaxID=160660 RepID=A0A1A6C7M1_9GAMM|nr:glycosyltransferase family 4 protein [Acidihalobacter prosperus]OBS10544.1 glycosyl transferase [Acidihalobacter prosperus]